MQNATDTPAPTDRPKHPWLLWAIALPAAVAIWSGWVGLGELCGFGVVNLLPGIGTGFHINTAITLPIGVEAYAAYALGAWMRPETPENARTFAQWSAIGALAYGCAGQVAYHLLTAWHKTAAPWPVVVVVSCMPVAVLGLAAGLTHLLRVPTPATAGTVSAPVFTDAQTAARAALARTVEAGNPLSQRQLMTRFRLNRREEGEVRQSLNGQAAGTGVHQ